MHPTANSVALIIKGSGGRVMPGVRCFAIFVMLGKFTFIFLVFGLCGLAASESALAQPVINELNVVPSNSSGEIASSEIDGMAGEAKKSGERLFVVVRLGAGETSRRLNLARLHNTRAYLSIKDFDPKTTVFAEGERVRGEGRIEFYLGSGLRLVLLAKRNKMPNLTCCDDRFPASGSKPKGRRRRSL